MRRPRRAACSRPSRGAPGVREFSPSWRGGSATALPLRTLRIPRSCARAGAPLHLKVRARSTSGIEVAGARRLLPPTLDAELDRHLVQLGPFRRQLFPGLLLPLLVIVVDAVDRRALDLG